MEQILQDALFLANVCNTLQISGYLKQELIDEHPALIEHINEATARIFAATQTTQAESPSGRSNASRETLAPRPPL